MKLRWVVGLGMVVLTAGLLAGRARGGGAGPAGTWDFEPAPDRFDPAALLNLRSLNEGTAGENGFVRVDPQGDFVLGNGQPVRFWAVNTVVGREKPFRARPRWRPTEPDLDVHAQFLARRGVNMVRLHAHLHPDLKSNPNAALTEIDTAERDWIWRTVAAMKKQGIYTVVSPYWANAAEIHPNWGVAGGKQNAHAVLFLDQALQAGYRAWWKALLTEKNPYTGVPLSQDPALAILQLQNEDSLLFWTINGLGAEQKRRFQKRFAAWARSRHGSLEAALAAWGGDRLPEDQISSDGGSEAMLGFHNVWEMTQERTGGRAARLADQLRFWADTQRRFHLETIDYLRKELGCRQLVNCGNWKTADAVRLNDVERYTYTPGEVIAVNRYFSGIHEGPNRGWAIVSGDQFTSPSALLDPRQLPIALKQVKGKASLVTESSWVMPMGTGAEGPFLISAYQSLTGVDGFFWFATGDDQWTPPQSANGYLPSQSKWIFGSPDVLGSFPAAALMYRKQYVRRAPPALEEKRSLEDLWLRRSPLIAEDPGFDPIRDAGSLAPRSSLKRGFSPYTFLVGPVEVEYESDASQSRAADLTQALDLPRKTLRGLTGEVTLNYGEGWCTVDAPCAQGAAAHFNRHPRFDLKDVQIDSQNRFGSALAVSLDGKPLRESARVLLQVATPARPTGWKESPVTVKVKEGEFPGFKVDDFGRAPWQVERAQVRWSVANPRLSRATQLDMNGLPVGSVPVTRSGDRIQLRFPETAMYVVLE